VACTNRPTQGNRRYPPPPVTSIDRITEAASGFFHKEKAFTLPLFFSEHKWPETHVRMCEQTDSVISISRVHEPVIGRVLFSLTPKRPCMFLHVPKGDRSVIMLLKELILCSSLSILHRTPPVNHDFPACTCPNTGCAAYCRASRPKARYPHETAKSQDYR
jgi:hypothetical protein